VAPSISEVKGTSLDHLGSEVHFRGLLRTIGKNITEIWGT
jgi:hypothetical protein